MDYKRKSYYLIIIAVISICTIVFISKPTDFKGWQVVNKYIQPKITIFIGDSITKGFELKEEFDDLIIINKGVDGNKTTDVLDRLDTDVYSFQPSKVFLLIGINDIGKNVESDEIINNIEKIVDNIRQNCPNITIYLQSIYPVNNTDDKRIDKKHFKYRNNKSVISINKKLKNLASHKEVVYIDVYSHLLDDDNNLKLSYTKEGLHLNKVGYEEVSKIINSYLYN